jgi:hypothetical protein
MTVATIPQLIPKLTAANFTKIIKSIGSIKYDILPPKTVVIYSPSKSRSDRMTSLKELADLLKQYGARYDKSSSASGAGAVVIGSSKIILKPEKVASSIILKPGLFGDSKTTLVDTDIPFSEYYGRVISAIRTTPKLSDEQKEVLIAIVEHTRTNTATSKSKMAKVLRNLGNAIPINTINNDFGEILGPIAIQTNGLLPIDYKSAMVRVPGRSNEPLLDYKITDKNKEFKISAKSGTTTNTLKPNDVIHLIKSDKKLYKKWKTTTQLQLLEILNAGSTKQGPIDAGIWLKDNGYAEQFKWLKKAEYSEEVRQKAENTIVQISRESLDFTPIFKDATESKVYYVKFRMTMTGDTEWKLVETPKDEKENKKTEKRVSFRSKNFVGRAKDKLGFQV